MKRFLVIFLALIMLNQSIDYDYLHFDVPEQLSASSFDDIDCFTEFFLEKFMGNDNYTSEEDDDSGNPQNKEIYKVFSIQDVLLPPEKICYPLLHFIDKGAITWASGLDLANKTSKGYFNVSSPPPDCI